MDNILIYPAGSSEGCRYAARFLQGQKIPLVDHPTPEVTHLLLDVPTNTEAAQKLLPMLPTDVTVVGGNLTALPEVTFHCLDFLKCEAYLSANAAITADCAVKIALPLLKTVLADTPTLVLGWGRIGKCLARMLRALDCPVAVAVRKERDLAALKSLGYNAISTQNITSLLPGCRLLFNTAPEMVLPARQLSGCENCIKIDLASQPGLGGEDVVRARGLPGKYAPESSGKLIAATLLHFIKEGI